MHTLANTYLSLLLWFLKQVTQQTAQKIVTREQRIKHATAPVIIIQIQKGREDGGGSSGGGTYNGIDENDGKNTLASSLFADKYTIKVVPPTTKDCAAFVPLTIHSSIHFFSWSAFAKLSPTIWDL